MQALEEQRVLRKTKDFPLSIAFETLQNRMSLTTNGNSPAAGLKLPIVPGGMPLPVNVERA
jgi:hypothetical protein